MATRGGAAVLEPIADLLDRQKRRRLESASIRPLAAGRNLRLPLTPRLRNRLQQEVRRAPGRCPTAAEPNMLTFGRQEEGAVQAMMLRRVGAPLEWTELPDRTPGPGETRVRVAACGVGRTDLHVVDGELPERRVPIIPGQEVVGRSPGDSTAPRCSRPSGGAVTNSRAAPTAVRKANQTCANS
jgi:alcohol dehydrogenase-like protein